MLRYILKRVLLMIPTLFVVSIISFVIIQLPPGDYLTTFIANKEAGGETVDPATVENLKIRYGLDKPVYIQYLTWFGGIVTKGDFGYSLFYKRPVADLIWERLGLTVLISLVVLFVSWIISFPIGIYSAVKKYSLGDYIATFLGFLGVATPDFLLALVLMVVAFMVFNTSVGGLYSPEFINAPWSWDKFVDLLKHLWIPVLILGTNGTAGLIRTMRANLLDELGKPYVTTARAKGQKETVLFIRYPVRAALNPFVSTVGWLLPQIVSGSTIVATVLSLPITGPLLLKALLVEDMYLAGAFIMMLSMLTVIGTFVSDILLAWLDPRIRLEG